MIWRYYKIIRAIGGVGSFFRNIYVFRKTLWRHRQWDYDSYFQFLQDFTKDFTSMNPSLIPRWEKKRRKAKVIGELARRVSEDEYFLDKFDYNFVDRKEININGVDAVETRVVASPLHDFPVKSSHVYGLKLRDTEFKYMCSLIQKHMLTFWD